MCVCAGPRMLSSRGRMDVKHSSGTWAAVEGGEGAGGGGHSRLGKQSSAEDTGKHYTPGEGFSSLSNKEFYGPTQDFQASKGQS